MRWAPSSERGFERSQYLVNCRPELLWLLLEDSCAKDEV